MRMFLAGEWQDRGDRINVTNPFNGAVLDTVPRGSAVEVDAALKTLEDGARVMRNMPSAERCRILRAASDKLRQRAEQFARTITLEEGKILAESRLEVSRAAETLDVSAEEAKRITGEVLPLDAAPGGAGKFGFTLRVPCGIVAAITPFNFPLNLVAHKVGPALAAGNAVLIKPSGD
ncbi:MAG TPA: aldehyde dehydrogenase family protein, partial [Planctomycetaceae bacterium]|nr:aldehyde dehydrogenase family protein [Planctomycetaceae bacterium]